jgi:hypothetical protein
MYGLRKIYFDPKKNFAWPLDVGSRVRAPTWNRAKNRSGGLLCLPNAQGNWGLLKGDCWVVLEFSRWNMVRIDPWSCKVKKCKIVFRHENPAGMITFFDINKFDSRSAYYWALNVGDHDIMIDKITDIYYAYCWGRYIGNLDEMIDRIAASDADPEYSEILLSMLKFETGK